MRGQDIPLITVIRASDDNIITYKRPKYELKSAKEIKAIQDKLGKNVGWYYGADCKECCGVLPAFYTEGGFRDFGYYVCLVCGKESIHKPMSWQARDAWNNDLYIYDPSDLNVQMEINDFLKV